MTTADTEYIKSGGARVALTCLNESTKVQNPRRNSVYTPCIAKDRVYYTAHARRVPRCPV